MSRVHGLDVEISPCVQYACMRAFCGLQARSVWCGLEGATQAGWAAVLCQKDTPAKQGELLLRLGCPACLPVLLLTASRVWLQA